MRLQPFVHRRSLDNSFDFTGHLFSRLAGGEETGGQLTIYEITLVSGHEPPRHTHANEDEAFYVLEGEVEYFVGAESAVAGPGDFIFLPQAVTHGFRTLTPRARLLLFIAPGASAEAFEVLGKPVHSLDLPVPAGEPDIESFVRAFNEHGITFPQESAPEPVENERLVRRPRVGESTWYMGHLMTHLVDGEDSRGRFALVQTEASPGQEPPRHIHENEDEIFYLLEGEATFFAGDLVHRATAGDLVFLPRGLAHAFRIETERAKALILVTPAGFENYFRAFSTPAPALTLPPPPDKPYDMNVILDISRQFGITFVPPAEEAQAA